MECEHGIKVSPRRNVAGNIMGWSGWSPDHDEHHTVTIPDPSGHCNVLVFPEEEDE